MCMGNGATQTKSVLFLVRHGQTDFNAKGRASGQIDCPINEVGRRQAEVLRNSIDCLGETPTQLIHSGLQRAKQTAEILNERLGLPVSVMSVFQEIHYGDWQDVCFKQIRQAQLASHTNPPNGEPYRLFEARVAAGLVMASDAYALPLVVCHGGVIEAIFGKHGFTVPEIENSVLYRLAGDFGNGCASEFEFDRMVVEAGVARKERLALVPAQQDVMY